MKYYSYAYANGALEFYRVIDGVEQKLSVRTGTIECVGYSIAGPSEEWLIKNANECDAEIFNTEFARVSRKSEMIYQGR